MIFGEAYGFSELTETDTKYLSADEDTYIFDEQGRLVMYVNAEPTRRNLPATISEEKALEIVVDVLSCCGLNPDEFQKTYLSYASENSTYYITMEKNYSVGISDTVQFCIRADGVLETVGIHYQHCDSLTPKQESYFQEQLSSYMAERMEKDQNLTGYSETVRYYSDEKKIYAMYDIELKADDSTGNEVTVYILNLGFMTE